MQKTIIAALLAAVLAGALGFFGGVTYQKSQATSFAGRVGQGGFNRQNGAGGANFAASIATGTVIAQDAQSITVKSADGGSKIVFISAQTQIDKQQILTVSDIKIGDQVGAVGQPANGGIDARTVQVIPPGGSFTFGGMGGRGAPGAGAPGAAAGTGAPNQ